MSELKDLVIDKRQAVLTAESRRLTLEARNLARKRGLLGQEITALSNSKYQNNLQESNRALASKISTAFPGIQFQNNELIGKVPEDLDAFIRLVTPKGPVKDTVEEIAEFLANLSNMLTTTVADVLRFNPSGSPSEAALDLVREEGEATQGLDLGDGLSLKASTEDSNDPIAVELKTNTGSIKLVPGDDVYHIKLSSNSSTSKLSLEIDENQVDESQALVAYGEHDISSTHISPWALEISAELEANNRQVYDAAFAAAHPLAEA
ncbi:MAG: hypothetical protein HOA17_02140 [Candidatus Melainabacteria bacterium]|jgi:hypothetical protein|nr:hypothetical protein [Candidatus Melainabacteria bacterium]